MIKKFTLMIAISLCFVAITIEAAPANGEHLKDAKLKLTCDNGKVFSSSFDNNGSFSFTGVDQDCDGFSLLLSGSGISVKPERIEMKRSVSSSVASPRDAATGQASGKRVSNNSSPVSYKFSGDLDGDGVPEDFTISFSSNGSSIQGKLTCNKYSNPASYDLKQNKK